MRNLTIKRNKSFVGSLAAMNIYVEDPISSEIVINGIPCRKLGALKNGEEKTFSIEEHAVKIFAIADKLSKEYCNDLYQLPEGSDDIFISGQNRFNPAVGNAFRFDGNDNELSNANRKKGTRKGLIVLLVAVMVGFVLGFAIVGALFSDRKPSPKSFSSGGMTITVTDEFQKLDLDQYTLALDSSKVAVFFLKEPFYLVPDSESYTLMQYADMVIEANGLQSKKMTADGGLVYFTYENISDYDNKTYKYFSYVYKSDSAFWLIQFATLSENASEYTDQFEDWARSVKFSD